MSITRHHIEWLSLVPNSGPFLSLPVLAQAFPQGLDARSDAARPLANPGGSAPRMRGAARRRWGRWRFDPPVRPFGRRGGGRRPVGYARPHAARDPPGR